MAACDAIAEAVRKATKATTRKSCGFREKSTASFVGSWDSPAEVQHSGPGCDATKQDLRRRGATRNQPERTAS